MSETNYKIEQIQEGEIEAAKMANVNTRPNSPGLYGTQAFKPAELKERMDKLALLAVRKVNELINAMHDKDEEDNEKKLYAFAKNLAIPSILTIDEGEETTNLLDFLTNLKTALEDGTFASMIKTEINSDSQRNVLEFLHYLQASYDGFLEQTNNKFDDIELLFNKLKLTSDITENTLRITLEKDEGFNTYTIDVDLTVDKDRLADSAVTEGKLAPDVLGKISSSFKGVTYDSASGILTFTRSDESTAEIDLPLELVVTGGEYDAGTKDLNLILTTGDKVQIPLDDISEKIVEDIEEMKESAEAAAESANAALDKINYIFGELHAYAEDIIKNGIENGGDS